MDTEALHFYATQSPVTEPGAAASLLDGMPRDIAGIARVARGLVIHYRADDPVAKGVPEGRLREIDTRYADAMLARIAELDQRPLDIERSPTERLVGCCRDFTVLFLTLARAAGIPCRARVGFSTYFAAGYAVDHEVAEVWDGARWRLVDAELTDDWRGPDGTPIDPLDVPHDGFLVGGAAWQACRSGADDPERFVVDPGLELPLTRSWPYLQHNVVHDLAALNKVEMVLWDGWGLADSEPADGDLELLDAVAALTVQQDPDRAELARLFDEPRLRAPDRVTSYDPLGGPPREVALR